MTEVPRSGQTSTQCERSWGSLHQSVSLQSSMGARTGGCYAALSRRETEPAGGTRLYLVRDTPARYTQLTSSIRVSNLRVVEVNVRCA